MLRLLLGLPIQHLNVDSEDTGNKNHQLNVIFIISYAHVMIKHLSQTQWVKSALSFWFIAMPLHSFLLGLCITGIWCRKKLYADGPQGRRPSIALSSAGVWAIRQLRAPPHTYESPLPPHTHTHTLTFPARRGSELAESILTHNKAHKIHREESSKRNKQRSRKQRKLHPWTQKEAVHINTP